MIGASADDARAKPLEVRTVRGGVRLAFNLPCAIRGQKFAKVFAGLAAAAGSAMRQFVRPHQHFVVFFRMDLRAGLEHHHVEAAFSENFCGHATAGSGADYANIINFWRTIYLRHSKSSSRWRNPREYISLRWFGFREKGLTLRRE